MAQHRSFLLLPDPSLSGDAAVHSASSEGGRVPGRGTPDSGNEGNLSAFVTGRATSDAASFDLRVQTSGGIVEGAAWAWRRMGEDNSGWRGSNDRRFIHALGDPFHPGGTGAPIPVARTEILYSERLGKEFVYKDRSGDQLDVLHREVGETEQPWVADIASFEGGIDFNGAESMMFAGCVLPDGAFRMVVFRNNDLDVYHSEDGLAWERVADNIHSRFAGRLATSFNGLWLVESGGYLMISAIENNVNGSLGLGTYLTTLVSSDRGSTWTEIDAGLIPLGFALARYGPSGVDRYAISVVGVGDAAGTFIYTNRSTASPTAFITARRSGFGSWGSFDSIGMGIGSTNFDRVILGRTATHIVALVVDYAAFGSRVTSPGEYGILTLDRRVALAGQTWKQMRQATSFDGSPTSRIGLGHAAWIGSSLAVLGKKYDWQTGARVDGAIYFRLGEAWSKAPLADLVWDGYDSFAGRPVGYQPSGPLFDAIEWHADYGLPLASTFSQWILNAGGGALGYRGDRLQMVAAVGDSVSYTWNDPTSLGSAPAVSWMTSSSPTTIGGSLIEWEVQIRSGSATASEVVGVRLESRDPALATDETRLTVRIDQTSAVIYDENASTAIATLTPSAAVYGSTPFADRWEFRWVLVPRPSSRPRLTLLMARKYGTTDWIASDLVQFSKRTAALTTYEQHVTFGILSAPASGITDCVWWSMRVHEGGDLRQAVQVASGDPLLADEERPHVVRGRECSPFPVAVVDGVEVSWGGGGGFDGDLFQSIVDYQYAAHNALLGPRFEWRSADSPSASENIVFTAGSEDHARFRHDALAVFGCNAETVQVEYDDDPAFPSPTAAGTLDLRRFDNLRISAVDGERVTIAGSALPEDGEVASNNARRFFAHVLAVPGGATSISAGDCFEIAEQRDDVLSIDSGAFLAATVGTTLAIYSDRGVLRYSASAVGRYLRVTVAAGSPPSDRFEIGALVAGSTLAFDVPLDWSHSDGDEPTATTFRSRSGISWAYIEGPPRRTVTGTVVGDAGTFRARLRNLLRSTSRYAERPVVLCMDDRDLTNAETTVLARIPGGVEFEQTGWRYLDAEDRWIPVGDASLTFDQDV